MHLPTKYAQTTHVSDAYLSGRLLYFTLRLRDQRNMWMQDGCKAYMASNGSCFMATWLNFKNHLLEVGLTQFNHRETVALWMLTTVGLFCSIMYELIGIEVGEGPITYDFTQHWGSITTLHDFGGDLVRPLDIFFWVLTISWSWLFGSYVKWPLANVVLV